MTLTYCESLLPVCTFASTTHNTKGCGSPCSVTLALALKAIRSFKPRILFELSEMK